MRGSWRSKPCQSLLPNTNQRYYYHNRFLKPGALARLRDSRVTARSKMLNLQIQISLSELLSPNSVPSSASSPGEQSNPVQNQIDFRVPCFASRINRPRCLTRKKLVAVAPIFIESEQL